MIRNLPRAAVLIAISVTFAALFAACSAGMAAPAPRSVAAVSTAAPPQAQEKTAPLESAQGNSDQQRMVIKDATLRLTVNNPQDTLTSITRLADEMGGWVVNSNSYQTTTRSGTPVIQASVAIRIPAQRLTEALGRIKAGAVSVDQEEITGKDVTREYTDLNSQLINLEAAEAQLRKIVTTPPAKAGGFSGYA